MYEQIDAEQLFSTLASNSFSLFNSHCFGFHTSPSLPHLTNYIKARVEFVFVFSDCFLLGGKVDYY